MSVILVPSLNTSGFDTTPGKLAPEVASICRHDNLPYLTTSYQPVPRNMLVAITQMQELQNRLPPRPYVIVASSFGAWVALQGAVQVWPDNLQGLILFEPLISVEGYAKSAGPHGRCWARHFGYKRKWEKDSPSFKIPASMVISMLEPENNLLDGRLKKLKGRPIQLIVKNPSIYKPSRYNEQVAEETGAHIEGLKTDKEVQAYLDANIRVLLAAPRAA